jgi:hypothetical protein
VRVLDHQHAIGAAAGLARLDQRELPGPRLAIVELTEVVDVEWRGRRHAIGGTLARNRRAGAGHGTRWAAIHASRLASAGPASGMAASVARAARKAGPAAR